MAIPQNFQTIMLPLLQIVADGKNHNMNDVIDDLADHFKLTEEEKNLQYPTGSDYIFKNKARFARLYLLKAGLLDYPQRGYIKISNDGLSVLAKKPQEVNLQLLEEFPKFKEFKKNLKEKSNEKKEKIDEVKEIESQTPQELIEQGYQKIKNSLSEELLDIVKKSSPGFFERLVVELLLSMGYGGSRKDAGKAIGQSGDGGIDGIINEDKLGLDVIYIQAKRWENVVGSKEIRNFIGSLVGRNASKGVFITTSGFTKDAIESAKNIPHKVILIDGEKLVQLMIENNVGVSKVTSYDIKKIDTDYFIED